LAFDYLTLGLYIFLIYWIVVAVLKRKGILARYNISAHGPLLIIRTGKGKRFLNKMAREKTFWQVFASIGSILMLISMIFMLSLVLYGNYVILTVKPVPTELNEPRNWLLIPGLNEFIPVWGWIGLAVALAVHEFSHGILCRVEGIKVKSVGLLVAVVPIGGFAEPDNYQLFGPKATKGRVIPGRKVATGKERTRILSAGVMANFCVAAIAFLFFFAILFSLQPVSENVLFVHEVVPGSPAEEAGLKSGMLITKIDNEGITSVEDIKEAMKGKGKNDVVLLLNVLHDKGKESEIEVVVGDITKNDRIGVMVSGFPTKTYLQFLQSIPSSLTTLRGWIILMVLPFSQFWSGGFTGSKLLLSYLYQPIGVASLLGNSVFPLADMLFWTAWINFYAGLFNCLPAIPLDGGHVFREMLNPVLGKVIREKEKKERFLSAITASITAIIFFSIFLSAVGPYILHW
jgi:membrane-associated protease RseP (regulator of RpoE activity)